jgi:hypothetical protein
VLPQITATRSLSRKCVQPVHQVLG